jgi:hypothetical protein
LLLAGSSHIHPELTDGTITGEQFSKLLDIEPLVLWGNGVTVVAADRECLWEMPINPGEVNAKSKTMAFTGLTQFSNDIPFALVAGGLGIEEAEPIMVLAGDYQVAHASCLGCHDNMVCIEMINGELLGQCLVVGLGKIPMAEYLF